MQKKIYLAYFLIEIIGGVFFYVNHLNWVFLFTVNFTLLYYAMLRSLSGNWLLGYKLANCVVNYVAKL